MTTLIDYIQDFSRFQVAVIGDLMLDKYIMGRATRISQEAPVPVVRVDHQKAVPGGAANVVRNLLELRAHSVPYGIIGNDVDGTTLTALLSDSGADTSALLPMAGRVTTVKTRVLASTQQVVRVDVEDTTNLQENLQDGFLADLSERLAAGTLDAIILEDYAKGVFTASFMDKVVKCAAPYHIPVTLDPHSSHPFDVKGLTLMTPNRQEAFALAEVPFKQGIGDPLHDEPLKLVGKILRERWNPELLLITLGGEGMALFTEGPEEPVHIPTEARQVFDVSGAGDTVMATMTLALLAGADPVNAAAIANHAAGVVVGKVGTAAITYPELSQVLEGLPLR